MNQILWRGSLVTCLILAGWGGYLVLAPEPAAPTLSVETPDRDLGELPVGEHPVVVRVVNPTGRAAEVMPVQTA